MSDQENRALSSSAGAPILEKVRSALRAISSASDLSPENSEFHEARYLLYRHAAENFSEEEVKEVLSDPIVCSFSAKSFDICAKAGEIEEQILARQALAEESFSLRDLYEQYFGQTYEDFQDAEYELMERFGCAPDPSSEVSYIGCGAIALPAFLLALKRRQHVRCVEMHHNCCDYTRSLVERFELSELITVNQSKAEEADYSSSTHIFSANWVFNRKQIIQRIAEFENARYLILRTATPDSLSVLVNSEVDIAETEAQGFKLLAATEVDPRYSLHSLLFERC